MNVNKIENLKILNLNYFDKNTNIFVIAKMFVHFKKLEKLSNLAFFLNRQFQISHYLNQDTTKL